MSNIKITAEELREKVKGVRINARIKADTFFDWLTDVMKNKALQGYNKVSFDFAKIETERKEYPISYFFLNDLFKAGEEVERGMVFDDLREAGYKVFMEYHPVFKDCRFEVIWDD